ncbi:peptidoglycan-binding domain-containing protein [Streptomyces bobili]|uniref:peptidoglycan-binding domain-containing protein n=1 Tax=Streptomyces bobili TaxID=67280 RepID=UPI000A38B4E2|nr:peptidoglycan-binding protein [Streptomyces bobili]
MVALSTVRFGKHNDEVKAIQAALIAVGIDIPAGVTGFFGEQTEAAYVEWQCMLGLTGSAADGFPDCSSLAQLGAMGRICCGMPPSRCYRQEFRTLFE